MATADELLAMINSDGNETSEFVIDSNFRTISVPTIITNLGVTSDNDVHRLYFRMPRMYCGTDLSTFNIRINYMNANNEGDIYVVNDKRIDENSITFSWLVGQNAVAYVGDVKFIVCLKEADAEGTVLREFNTTVTTMPVLEGLEVDAAPLKEDLHDILEQLQNLPVEQVANIKAEGSSQIEKVKTEGSSQITKVQEESLKQQANLVEKGKEVLATIPEEYQNTVKLAEEAIHTKADAIVNTVEGDIITISDAADDLVREIKLYGKTEQFSTTGAQLFNVFGKQNNKFGTVTIENDGTKITVNGTYYVSWPISLKAGNNYYVNFKAQTKGGYVGIRFEYSNNEVSDVIAEPSVFTPARDVISMYLYASMGTKNSVVYENVQINKGSVPLAYEPFTGGVASPSPDYPQVIKSVENPILSIFGNNLLPFPYGTDSIDHSNAKMTILDDGGIKCEGTPTDYVSILLYSGPPIWHGSLTFSIMGDYRNISMEVAFVDENNEMLYGYTGTEPCAVNLDEYPTIKTVRYGFKRSVVNVPISGIVYPMITAGPNIQKQFDICTSQSITLPYSLHAVPVNSGGNYTDGNGQQWVRDEIDFERGVYVKRICYADLTKASIVTEVYSGITRFVARSSEIKAGRAAGIGICNAFHVGLGPVSGNVSDNTISCFYAGNAVYWRCDMCASVEEMMNVINELGIVYMYPLLEPIEIPLTADEIAAFETLHTNYPNTTIMNDAGAWMSVEYHADTKTWIANLIDKKIAEAMSYVPH